MDKLNSVRPLSLGDKETLILVLSNVANEKLAVEFGLRILFVKKRTYQKCDKAIFNHLKHFPINSIIPDNLKKESPVHFDCKNPYSKSNYIYILGKKYSINNSSNKDNINAINFEQVIKALSKQLKPVLVSLIDHFLSKLNMNDVRYSVCLSKPHTFLARILYNREPAIEKLYKFKFCYFVGAFHPAIISALVAHEVAHIIHGNHGKEFKKLLLSLVPQYKYLSDCLLYGYINGENNEYAE